MTTLHFLIIESKLFYEIQVEDVLVVKKNVLITKATNLSEALKIIKQNKPDYVLLNPNMENNKAGEIAQIISSRWQIPILILGEFSSKEKEFPPPYSQSFPEPRTFLNLHININFKSGTSEKIKNPYPSKNSFLILDKNTKRVVHVEEVFYLKSDRGYLTLFLKNGEQFTLCTTLSSFTTQFSHPNLLRVHRSFIVNITHTVRLNGRQLVLGEIKIPFSKSYEDNVLKHWAQIKNRPPKLDSGKKISLKENLDS